jgi:Zn-dependent protease with chaperone function
MVPEGLPDERRAHAPPTPHAPTSPRLSDLYPRGPEVVPPDLTALTARYRGEVVLVALGLLVFAAVYVGLLGAALYGVVWIWQHDLRGQGSVALALLGTAVLVAIVVFLGKGLFRTQRRDPRTHIEVTRADEPLLFAFLDRLVADTGAPSPAKVFLSWEVNAAVFYETTILSLFLPVRKNLLIGLGLVNHLNLSELKAVLAHELGHFSQRSMRLGSYVYVSNQILDDVIWGRDGFDELLEGLKRSDARLAIVGYAIAAIVWLLRKALELIFRLVNVLHRSLMRQMEFAADRVAISVAGSRAMARGLFMAELADACFAQTMHDLRHAGDHGLYTKDLFHHQSRAVDEVRRAARRPDWGLVDDARPRLFAHDAQTKPSMWATHPPSAEREEAGWARPVDCVIDERSAWALFRDPARWRRTLTERFVFGAGQEPKRLPVEPEEVQRFIDAEREETAVAGRYADMYEGRPLARLDVEGIVEEVARAPLPDSEMLRSRAALETRIRALSEQTRALQDELRLAAQAAQGQLRGARFRAAGRDWTAHEARDALAAIDAEQRRIDRAFEDVDVAWLRLHASVAVRAADGSVDRLATLYAFLLVTDALLSRLQSARGVAQPSLARLFSGERLEEPQIQELFSVLLALHHHTERVLSEAASVTVPALKNLEATSHLGPFLLDRPLVPSTLLVARQLDGAYLQRLLGDVGEILDKLARLRRKALGAVIALQEDLVRRVQERPSFDVADVRASRDGDTRLEAERDTRSRTST